MRLGENPPVPAILYTGDRLCWRSLTALCAQTQNKKLFESVAKQHFQKVSCGSFDRKLL